ncbi:MAG: hypothetical protein KDJ70_09835, partial [Candidatus Competibacteraceae bacterium]|nr:hypothetical protein [Candidatus Competibacteraceae bacterium]
MNHHLACGISTLALCCFAAPALAGDEPSRFIENETISTIVGDFEFTKGFPTPETSKKLFDIRTTYRVMEVIQQNTF